MSLKRQKEVVYNQKIWEALILSEFRMHYLSKAQAHCFAWLGVKLQAGSHSVGHYFRISATLIHPFLHTHQSFGYHFTEFFLMWDNNTP